MHSVLFIHVNPIKSGLIEEITSKEPVTHPALFKNFLVTSSGNSCNYLFLAEDSYRENLCPNLCFRFSIVSEALIFPFSRIAIFERILYTSSRSCEQRKIVFPPWESLRISCLTFVHLKINSIKDGLFTKLLAQVSDFNDCFHLMITPMSILSAARFLSTILSFCPVNKESCRRRLREIFDLTICQSV